jgi:Domain of unknown function (DUF4118)
VIGRRARLLVWAASFAAPLALAALLVAVRSSFANAAAALALVALIVVVAVVLDRVAGYLATVSAGAWFDFFLTRPYGQFTISHRPDLETFVALVVVGAGVTELAQWSRRSARRHDESARLVAVVAEGGALASSTTPSDAIALRVCALLEEVLALRSCRYESGPSPHPGARLGPSGEVENAGLVWPVGEWGLPGPELEIPVSWRGRFRGRFVLTPRAGRPVSLERRMAAVALAEAVASALPSSSGRAAS